MTTKGRTEKLFESYLNQHSIGFDYEPFGNGGKNPDYRFVKNGKTVLVEIKEIEETPFDKAVKEQLAISPKVSIALDPNELYTLLRRRIDAACKQLKPHEADADACVIILGKKEDGFDGISPDSIFYAMFGDLYLSFPIDPKQGGAIGEAAAELKVNGALRKNRPTTREMYSLHPYLSAVGVVEEFKGRSEYERKFYNELLKKHRPPSAEECLKYLSDEWERHQNQIPAIYHDENKMFYRVRMVANPLSTKPLPQHIFNGQWDYARFPKVMQQ